MTAYSTGIAFSVPKHLITPHAYSFPQTVPLQANRSRIGQAQHRHSPQRPHFRNWEILPVSTIQLHGISKKLFVSPPAPKSPILSILVHYSCYFIQNTLLSHRMNFLLVPSNLSSTFTSNFLIPIQPEGRPIGCSVFAM